MYLIITNLFFILNKTSLHILSHFTARELYKSTNGPIHTRLPRLAWYQMIRLPISYAAATQYVSIGGNILLDLQKLDPPTQPASYKLAGSYRNTTYFPDKYRTSPCLFMCDSRESVSVAIIKFIPRA